MQAGNVLETAEIAKAEIGAGFGATATADKRLSIAEGSYIPGDSSSEVSNEFGKFPSDEELVTLRRVSGPIPWMAYSVCFVELCERFSYYGTTAVFTNFIQQPLPDGSSTGAGKSGQSGALGMGQRAAFGLNTFNSFWSYITPMAGAYLADTYWGRYKTIQLAIVAAMVGHIILIISALPPVLTGSGGIGAFAIGLVIMGIGTGGFKSNISPLLAEQQTVTKMYVKTLASGERVIVDPIVTTSRMFLYYYACINIGSLVGQIGMVYAEKYVGFWLAYTLPTIMFATAPFVLFVCKKHYHLYPPTGSVLARFFQLWTFAQRGCWSINPVRTIQNFRRPGYWERVKPSQFAIADRPHWMTFDDAWVDEVARGLKACTVFLWLPLYWLAYNQMTSNLTSQSATMELHGAPNDIIQNLNPISLIIFIPIMDFFVYPAIRKARIPFTPLKRICLGFFLASSAMISACVVQHYIYKLGPCGDHMNSCDDPAPINVWVQTVPYVLIGFSEIMASITGLEYAFTKAPVNMRSLVMSVNLFMNAISSAIAQALVSLSDDPLLVVNYGVVAGLAFAGGVGFWLAHHRLDSREEQLNLLQESSYRGKHADEEIAREVEQARRASVVTPPPQAEKSELEKDTGVAAEPDKKEATI